MKILDLKFKFSKNEFLRQKKAPKAFEFFEKLFFKLYMSDISNYNKIS